MMMMIDESTLDGGLDSGGGGVTGPLADEVGLALFNPLIRTFLWLLYGATTVTGVTGNLLVILILIQGTDAGYSRVMRHFLVSLALSDIVMSSFAVPLTFADFVYNEWIFWQWGCHIYQFAMIISVFVSINTSLAISLDRYYSICRPLAVNYVAKQHKSIIGLTWLVGTLLGLVQFAHSNLIRVTIFYDEDEGLLHVPDTELNKYRRILMRHNQTELEIRSYYKCMEDWSDQKDAHLYTVVIFLATYLLPGLLIAILYHQIGRSIMNRRGPAGHLLDDEEIHRRIKMIRMLRAIVALFYFCWTPIQVLNVIIWVTNHRVIPNNSAPEYLTFAWIFIGCHWLAMSNSFVNPIIYCYMSNAFKNDMNQWFRRAREFCIARGWLVRESRIEGRRTIAEQDGAGGGGGGGLAPSNGPNDWGRSIKLVVSRSEQPGSPPYTTTLNHHNHHHLPAQERSVILIGANDIATEASQLSPPVKPRPTEAEVEEPV